MKICLNDAVWAKYYEGDSLNDAISDVFSDEIKERVEGNKKFAEFNPLNMVMYDAGIKKTSRLESMMNGEGIVNSAYTSGGMDVNKWLFPAWVETTLREKLYETDYLPYLVTNRMGVDSNTVQSPTLNLDEPKNKRAIKKARIAELADIPTGKITIGEQAITLWKRGRAISFSYEAARRMRIELFKIQMSAIASDLAHQELEHAADVLINGDGNTGSEPAKIGTTSKAGTIEAGDIADALMGYSSKNHFDANTIIVPTKHLKTISGMVYDSQLRAGAMVGLTFNIPQINFREVTILGLDDVQVDGKDAMILLNREKTLIRYEENGSNIQEMERFIRNQEQLMTLTENSGYAIATAGSNMYFEIKGA